MWLFQTASSSQEETAEVREHFAALLSAFSPLYITADFQKIINERAEYQQLLKHRGSKVSLHSGEIRTSPAAARRRASSRIERL